jgi:hypothetical protein
MKSYVLSWAGSGATSEINAANDADAIREAVGIIGGDPVVSDDWDADGFNADDEPCKRLLFWANEADAENDAGANAVAQLSTVGSA